MGIFIGIIPRKLHYEELNGLHYPTDIIRMIKLKKMRWVVNVASMGERRDVNRFQWGNLRERYHLGDPDVDGRIILRWIFRMWVREWTGFSWLRIWTGGGHLLMR